MMANLQILRDRRMVAVVEQLSVVDAFYGITPEERTILDVIHGLSDIQDSDD